MTCFEKGIDGSSNENMRLYYRLVHDANMHVSVTSRMWAVSGRKSKL